MQGTLSALHRAVIRDDSRNEVLAGALQSGALHPEVRGEPHADHKRLLGGYGVQRAFFPVFSYLVRCSFTHLRSWVQVSELILATKLRAH